MRSLNASYLLVSLLVSRMRMISNIESSGLQLGTLSLMTSMKMSMPMLRTAVSSARNFCSNSCEDTQVRRAACTCDSFEVLSSVCFNYLRGAVGLRRTPSPKAMVLLNRRRPLIIIDIF